MRRTVRRRAAAAAAVLLFGGCELREITLTEPEHAVIVEAYVWLAAPALSGAGDGHRASVLLHETLGPSGGSGPVPGAEIVITRLADLLAALDLDLPLVA